MKRMLLGIALGLVCFQIGWAVTGQQALYCKYSECPTCPPGNWITSIHPVSGTDNAVDLLSLSNGGLAVLKYIPATDKLFKYDGTCREVTRADMLGAGTPTSGEGGACGCFCVDASVANGYFLIRNAPGFIQYVANSSGPLPVTLSPGFNFWMSPDCPPVSNTAFALMNEIGFASVFNVQRYIQATNGFEIYTGRKGSPNVDFPIERAETYVITMNSTVPFTPGANACTQPTAACAGAQRNFLVAGSASSPLTYDWRVEDATGLVICESDPTDGILVGGDSASVIAQKIVTEVVNRCSAFEVTAFTQNVSPYFDVTATGSTPGPTKFWIGQANLPLCLVTFNSPCTFNPTVFDIVDPGGGGGPVVPTLSQWATIHMMLLLIAVGTALYAGRLLAAHGAGATFTGFSGRVVVDLALLAKTTLAAFVIAVVVLGLATLLAADPLPARDWFGAGTSALITGYVLHLWILVYRSRRS